MSDSATGDSDSGNGAQEVNVPLQEADAHLVEKVGEQVNLINGYIAQMSTVETKVGKVMTQQNDLVEENRTLNATLETTKEEWENTKNTLNQEIQELKDASVADKTAHGAELERLRKESADKQKQRDGQWLAKLKETSATQFGTLSEQHTKIGQGYDRIMKLLGNNRVKRQTVSTRGEKLRRLVEKEREKLEGKFELRGLGHHATNGSPVAIGQDSLAGPFGGYLN